MKPGDRYLFVPHGDYWRVMRVLDNGEILLRSEERERATMQLPRDRLSKNFRRRR